MIKILYVHYVPNFVKRKMCAYVKNKKSKSERKYIKIFKNALKMEKQSIKFVLSTWWD